MGLTAAAAVAVDGDNVAPEIDPSAGDAPKIRRETVLGETASSVGNASRARTGRRNRRLVGVTMTDTFSCLKRILDRPRQI